MKISARNQFPGIVSEIKTGAVNSEVTVKLTGGESIVSVVTNDAVKNLGLSVGKKAYAIVKASNVLLAAD